MAFVRHAHSETARAIPSNSYWQSFTVSIGREPETLGNSALIWLDEKKFLKVGGFSIESPNTYTAIDNPRTSEASCVNVRLAVGTPTPEAKGALGYWPRYSAISPNQRANYLQWLAGGRKAVLDDVGYVFLYFYGLERRALIDKQDHQMIVIEVLRLLKTYGKSRSFFGYASSFLSYVFASLGVHKLAEPWFQKVFVDGAGHLHEDSLAVALAWLRMSDQPLPSQLALEVARQDSRSPRSVVLKRLPDEFETLFRAKYEREFPNGLSLTEAKRSRKIDYRPASPTLLELSYKQLLMPLAIPDVLEVSSQFKPLIKIWNECLDELKPLSRKAAAGLSLNSRQAYESLPDELKKEVDHPDKPQWDAIVKNAVDGKGRIFVPVSTLAATAGVACRAKLTMRQSLELATTALSVGYYLIPDPRTILRPYEWNEMVALVTALDDSNPDKERNYLAAALMLEIGTAMAAADGTVEKAEILHVSDIVNNQFRFASDDWRRLGVLRSLFIKYPPKLTGIGKRVKKILNAEELEGVGKFLVGVAASNGEIELSEREALLKAYKSLGIPIGMLKSLLSELEGELAEIRPAQASAPGEAIPPATSELGPRVKVELNREVLEKIKADTAKVAVLIGQAMGELDIKEDEIGFASLSAETSQTVPNEDDTEFIEELESKYQGALKKIITADTWPKSSFDDLVRSFNLMPSGTVDAINTWSDEFFEEYLIVESGGDYKVRCALLRGEK